jgi:hypothetical protein
MYLDTYFESAIISQSQRDTMANNLHLVNINRDMAIAKRRNLVKESQIWQQVVTGPHRPTGVETSQKNARSKSLGIHVHVLFVIKKMATCPQSYERVWLRNSVVTNRLDPAFTAVANYTVRNYR